MSPNTAPPIVYQCLLKATLKTRVRNGNTTSDRPRSVWHGALKREKTVKRGRVKKPLRKKSDEEPPSLSVRHNDRVIFGYLPDGPPWSVAKCVWLALVLHLFFHRQKIRSGRNLKSSKVRKPIGRFVFIRVHISFVPTTDCDVLRPKTLSNGSRVPCRAFSIIT